MVTVARRSAAFRLMSVFLGVAAFMGCRGAEYATAERMDKGLVLMLPGIEGPSPNTWSMRKGLADGGLPYALEVYDWRNGRIGAEYAFDEPAARERAREIARRIADYREDYPSRPVFIVGHSGGGAMAVFAAEATSDGSPLDGIIILEGALGPHYDLTCAVKGARGHVVNCHAWNDILLRSLTTVGRNFDGARGETAGQEGFTLPEDASPERVAAFASVRQIPWDSAMLKEWNWGGHFGVASSKWIAGTIAPIISEWGRASSATPR